MRTECWGWEFGFALTLALFWYIDLLGVIQLFYDVR
jgi:hypothetical protein